MFPGLLALHSSGCVSFKTFRRVLKLWEKCWRCSQNCLTLFSLYLARFFDITYPKFSWLWRRCFVEFFCWYELFMNLRADFQKMKLAKILTQKLYNKVVLTSGSRNARWSHKHAGVQKKAVHIWKRPRKRKSKRYYIHSSETLNLKPVGKRMAKLK